jgi:hypothetical protein
VDQSSVQVSRGRLDSLSPGAPYFCISGDISLESRQPRCEISMSSGFCDDGVNLTSFGSRGQSRWFITAISKQTLAHAPSIEPPHLDNVDRHRYLFPEVCRAN